MAKVTVVENPSEVDWDQLMAHLHSAFAYMDGRINPPSSLHRMDANQLRLKAEVESLFLAFNGNELVGCMFCRVEPEFIYVGKVAVSAASQGQGIGKQLFNAAFELAHRLGRPELELETPN